MTAWEVVLVARVPQSAAPPTLTTINRLIVNTVSYVEELNRPGTATLGCPIRSLSDDVKDRLVNLVAFPCEVWIYQDDDLVWAGEIQTLSVQNQTVTLNCVGLLGYTYRMGITSNLTYTGVDQFTIAKGLVDHWQALLHGNFGIDTSGIGLSGITRDRTYLRNELHNVGQRLADLGKVDDGFDLRVDPLTRDLVLDYPESGTDLSASVFLDERNIDSASVAMSVSPDDIVSNVYATGTSTNTGGTNTTLYAAWELSGVRSSFGRSWGSKSFDGVSVQGTLDDHATAYLVARSQQLFQPGVTIIPRPGAQIGDFHAGDTISYSYDAGLGLQSNTFRVAKVKVDINEEGRQRLGVEFV